MLIRSHQGETIEKEWKNLDEISNNMITAAVASEDNNFYGHRGIDFGAVQKAINYNKIHSKVRGASTISQQTAKNVFLWSKRSWIRKGFEVYYTFLIEQIWGKERIMEVYLNVIEMGHGIYGVEAAAKHYFHRSAKKLNANQSSLIAACFPNPRKWNPAHPTGYIMNRALVIQSLIPKMPPPKFDKEHLEKARERYEKKEKKRIEKNGGKRLQF